MIEARLRTVISPADLEAKKGKIVTDDDYNVVLTGPAKLLKPNGEVLCVYLPGAVKAEAEAAYDVLHMLRNERTDNRGMASGTERMKRGDQARTRSSLVPSALIGSVDGGGSMYRFCRLTSWTGRHLDEWASLRPLFGKVNDLFRRHIPNRWAAQKAAADATHPEWVIPGTVFTTVTVNNTYSTGVHQDAGDLKAGFSTIVCLRRGEYTGGVLVFVRYRVAVDLQDGDLLLLDPHEWHGNTVIDKLTEDAERISVVSYYREGMSECDTAEAEAAKAQHYADSRSGITTDDPGCC